MGGYMLYFINISQFDESIALFKCDRDIDMRMSFIYLNSQSTYIISHVRRT